MNKVVFLDRDGTINIDYGFVHEVDKLEFLPGSLDALRRIYEAGYKLIIVTNQSGISRGMFSTEEYEAFTSAMLSKMKDEGVHIEKIYTCPHIDEDNCECRKPKLGLFEQAIKEYDVDLQHSYAIGDRIRDLKICDKYPICGIYLDADIEITNQDDASLDSKLLKYIIRKTTWEDIANYICENN